MNELITHRVEVLKGSLQIAKYLNWYRMRGASKLSFKMGKNLFKPAIAFKLCLRHSVRARTRICEIKGMDYYEVYSNVCRFTGNNNL